MGLVGLTVAAVALRASSTTQTVPLCSRFPLAPVLVLAWRLRGSAPEQMPANPHPASSPKPMFMPTLSAAVTSSDSPVRVQLRCSGSVL